MDAGRINETGRAKQSEKRMTTTRNLLRAFPISFLTATFVLAVVAQEPTPTPNAPECSVPIYKGNDVDKNVKILAKPEPQFTKAGRNRYHSKEITLRACFCGSGKVTDIIVTNGLSDDMNERAIDASRQIQFTPATKDGKNVSRILIIKYWVRD